MQRIKKKDGQLLSFSICGMSATVATARTRVVNCRVNNLRQNGFQSFQQWRDASRWHIYVGRLVRYVPGTEHTEWGNPYKGPTAVKDYETFLRAKLHNDADKRRRLVALRGYVDRL